MKYVDEKNLEAKELIKNGRIKLFLNEVGEDLIQAP